MFTDILKIILLIAVLSFMYMFLQNKIGGNMQWDTATVTGRNMQLQTSDESIWNNPSPFQGKVMITTKSTPTEREPQQEYIVIEALRTNEEAISLTGWSLRSIVSNTRMYIPPATLLLNMSGKNETQPVYLAPGEYAIINSGYSPISNIANSFHTNTCIGYVSALNDFAPPIKSACNDPAEILPATPQNITTYGATCVEFFAQAKSCKSYTLEMPAHLLPACRELIARTLNYHACLSAELEKNGYDIFNNGGWYLYLNHTAEIWRNNYEAIQLLDENGLVVDVFKY